MSPEMDVAVVGAGAAGLAAAIFAARRDPSLRIAALDGAKKPGAKILVSGGGRCNVTNTVVTPDDFNGGSRNVVRRILSAFPAERAVAFFREIGVPLKEEPGGKLFPVSDSARTVLDALLGEARRRGVRLLAGHRVTGVDRVEGGFHLQSPHGPVDARRVILCTGGLSLPKTGSDGAGYGFARRMGHSIVETTPALAPLVLEGTFHRDLSGIAHDVEITVTPPAGKRIRIAGAMLWTHFGVSGPAALDASRHWLRQEGAAMTVNLLPGHDFTRTEWVLLQRAKEEPRLHLRNALSRILPARLADAVLSEIGLDGSVAMAGLTREARRRLVSALLEWPLPVRDSRGYRYAEVTAGGVPLAEITPSTLASRPCPGLHLAGEILDVDGRIGGFNFQWAWSSGWVAAAGVTKDFAAGGR